MREREKREYYWDGFRDALLWGHPNPGKPEFDTDSRLVAYQRGYDDGARAVSRIVSEAREDTE